MKEKRTKITKNQIGGRRSSMLPSVFQLRCPRRPPTCIILSSITLCKIMRVFIRISLAYYPSPNNAMGSGVSLTPMSPRGFLRWPLALPCQLGSGPGSFFFCALSTSSYYEEQPCHCFGFLFCTWFVILYETWLSVVYVCMILGVIMTRLRSWSLRQIFIGSTIL